MSTLLLRLAGPMQAWGVQSRFGVRDTGREPSKSGVIGLLCAALGRPREADISDLAALRMGVRVDQEGLVQRDFHTAGTGGYLTISGSITTSTIPSKRYYLADARFLAGLESDDGALLTLLHQALCNPHWPLCLGRRAFPPGEPVWLRDGLCDDQDLEEALGTYYWLGTRAVLYEQLSQVRLLIEDPHGEAVRRDQPLSFAERTFASRRVRTVYIPRPRLCLQEVPCTSPN